MSEDTEKDYVQIYQDLSSSPFFTSNVLMEEYDMDKNEAFRVIHKWEMEGMITYPLPLRSVYQTTAFKEKQSDPDFVPELLSTHRRYFDFFIVWAHIQTRMPSAHFDLESYKALMHNFAFLHDHRNDITDRKDNIDRHFYDAFRNDTNTLKPLLVKDGNRYKINDDCMKLMQPVTTNIKTDSHFEKWCRSLDLNTLLSALNPSSDPIHMRVTLRRIQEVQFQPDGQFKALPYLRRFQQATEMTIEEMKQAEVKYAKIKWPTQEALDSDFSSMDESVRDYKKLSEAQRLLLTRLENLFLFTDELAYQISTTKKHAVWRTLKSLQDNGLIKRVPYFENTYRHALSDIQMRFFNAPTQLVANNDLVVDWCLYWSKIQEGLPGVGFTPTMIRETITKRPDLVFLPEPKYWKPVELESHPSLPNLMQKIKKAGCITEAPDGNPCLTKEFMDEVRRTRKSNFNQEDEVIGLLSCLPLKSIIPLVGSNAEDYVFLYAMEAISKLRLEKDTKTPDLVAQRTYMNRLCQYSGMAMDDLKAIAKKDPSIKVHFPTRIEDKKQPRDYRL